MNIYERILYDDVDSVKSYHDSHAIEPIIPPISGFMSSNHLELASAISLSSLRCVKYYIYELDTHVTDIHINLATHAKDMTLQDAKLVYDIVIEKAKNDYIKSFINDEFW